MLKAPQNRQSLCVKFPLFEPVFKQFININNLNLELINVFFIGDFFFLAFIIEHKKLP